MKLRIPLLLIATLTLSVATFAQRTSVTLTEGWQFTKGDGVTDANWQNVRIPHDWAIYGPFDRANDLQEVAIFQNGENTKTWKTGRTGGLPFIGKGTYKRTFHVADTTNLVTTLIFDGAMSNAQVIVNGKQIAFWPYGYNSFYVQLPNTNLNLGDNELVVKLENFEQASRWYPGAGLYRNVHLVITNRVHIPTWGTYVTTPHVTKEYASVSLMTKIEGLEKNKKVEVITTIHSPKGATVASDTSIYVARGQDMKQNFLVNKPQLWSTEDPYLYTAKTTLISEEKVLDQYETRFGIRSIEYVPEKGFFLNGKVTKFRGVCNHHDLGPLGAAVNRSALRHELELLKDMGCNAIRTAHNMPAPELVKLCDEMGVMLMIEPFDDWGFNPKSANGYGKSFNEWAKKDIINMVEHYRNSPSVVMWSIGNEVPSQWGDPGMQELTMLQDLVHQLDPTRPVTCGMDQIGAVLSNGFAAALDIPAFNYKPTYYLEAYNKLPQKLILGSETASTVSSRGIYHFPIEWDEHLVRHHDDNQSSSYDNESCAWSNTPDIDFAMDEDYPWMMGQFVWTGFDYIGEPSPYDTDTWPSHSSYFGIIDLASLPKDRFYLYRSIWNKNDNTLHILPHWNWKGREGMVTPIFVYTNYPKAELFINGKSQGVREKNKSTLQNRFRLMWNETVYEPGEVRVVAYDSNGVAVTEKTMRTTGAPHHIVLKSSRAHLNANGEDLAYITVQVADKDGNIVPTDTRRVKFSVRGNGSFEATANGDPTCLLPFQNPEMDLFSGAATAIVRCSKTPGKVTLRVTARGVRSAIITLDVK